MLRNVLMPQTQSPVGRTTMRMLIPAPVMMEPMANFAKIICIAHAKQEDFGQPTLINNPMQSHAGSSTMRMLISAPVQMEVLANSAESISFAIAKQEDYGLLGYSLLTRLQTASHMEWNSTPLTITKAALIVTEAVCVKSVRNISDVQKTSNIKEWPKEEQGPFLCFMLFSMLSRYK